MNIFRKIFLVDQFGAKIDLVTKMGNLWFGLVYIRLLSPVEQSGIPSYLRDKVELEAVLLAF